MPGGVSIDLLRHGETGRAGFRGRLDDSLTPTGWEQMQRAVEPNAGWQAVVTSPLVRCAKFAESLARRGSLPLEQDARLAELHFGDWEGADAEQLIRCDGDALSRFWHDPWAATPPNGEPLAAFEQRVRHAWCDISQRHPGRRVLVVTHAGVIRLLLCLERGLSRNDLLALRVPHGSLHRIGACP